MASTSSPVHVGTPQFLPRNLGRTGTRVSPIGLGSSYGVSGTDVERAFDRGVSFFLWGSRRRHGFGQGLARLGQRNREEMVIAVQTYTRIGALMEWSVDRSLRALKTDYVDLLTLSWWNGIPPQRIVDAALKLRDKGKVRNLMVSCHHRPTFEHFIKDPSFDALMVRYNAAHPGAEREVFPHLEAEAQKDPSGRRTGVVAFTATRWGTLLNPALQPPNEIAPRASDCYRFAMSSPYVDVTLSGPKDSKELDEALEAVARGPMDEEELAWMRRVGSHVRDMTAKPRKVGLLNLADRLARFSLCAPRTLHARSS